MAEWEQYGGKGRHGGGEMKTRRWRSPKAQVERRHDVGL